MEVLILTDITVALIIGNINFAVTEPPVETFWELAINRRTIALTQLQPVSPRIPMVATGAFRLYLFLSLRPIAPVIVCIPPLSRLYTALPSSTLGSADNLHRKLRLRF